MAADWLIQAALGGEDEAQPIRWLATLPERDRAMTGAAAAELALDLGELGSRLILRWDDASPLGRDEVARRAGEHASVAGRSVASVLDVAWANLAAVTEGTSEPHPEQEAAVADVPVATPATRV
jgi:hypothetical protein